jgi:cardiolipin synthase
VIHQWNHSVLHAKVATVDGCRLVVGSFNLDPLSLANQETLVEVTDTHLVGQADAWIAYHFARSIAMTSVEASTWRQRGLLDPLVRLVARLADRIGVIIARCKRRKKRSRVTPGRGAESSR